VATQAGAVPVGAGDEPELAPEPAPEPPELGPPKPLAEEKDDDDDEERRVGFEAEAETSEMEPLADDEKVVDDALAAAPADAETETEGAADACR
jgi:hypothetical protein